MLPGVTAETHFPAGLKTTLYYDPEGRCEAAYIELAPGRALRREEPDPRYLVSVYFGEGDVPLGIRISEHAPHSVIAAIGETLRGRAAPVGKPIADALALVGSI